MNTMDFLDSFISVPEPNGFWAKSKFSRNASKILTVLFLIYVFGVVLWQHVIFFAETSKLMGIFPSAEAPDLQHTFRIACYDPEGCIVATRRNDANDNDILNATSDPSDPCNNFKTQYFNMQYNEIRKASICFTADQDNGVAVLVHAGGNIKVLSSVESDAKITNEKDWPHTIGYQKVVSVTVITTNQLNGDHSDDWLVSIQENLVFEMTGDFFRCEDGISCGCTVSNGTWTDCEAFILRLADVTYQFDITPRYTYVTILAQIGGLILLGFFVFRLTTGSIFYFERRNQNRYTMADPSLS